MNYVIALISQNCYKKNHSLNPSNLLISVNRLIVLLALFKCNSRHHNIKPKQPKAFCLIEIVSKLCIVMQSSRFDTWDFPFITTIGKIVHLLFFLSSFWRRYRGLPKIIEFTDLFQLEFCCSTTKILFSVYFCFIIFLFLLISV